ncbi:MAG: protein-glutamate O-methyltransferase CheR, partial [Coriobacteriia bacterium]|nr:protein-glutamate O-methyltransferase CheR [Coriobacteriia bacterium]
MGRDSLAKDLTLEEFARFRDFIHQQSGIFLEESKLDSLRISLVTRATRLDFSTFDAYYALLVRDHKEFNELMNLVTINETSFFRFPQQFDALKNRVLPEIMSAKPENNKNFRVWSAGCSTGEEPYSVAMTLLDAGIDGLGWKSQVLGTDVSTRALAVGQKGVYGKRAMINVPKETVARHFETVPDGHRVSERARKLVDFGYHNLIKEPYPLSLMGNWDVIFCRNVTIYFRLDSTRRVVSNYYNSLNEGGYLFIGHSETLTSISDQFEPVEVGGVFLYRKTRTRKVFGVSVPRVDSVSPLTEASRFKKAERLEKSTAVEAAEATAASKGAAGATGPEMLEQARAALAAGHPERVMGLVADVLAEDPNNAEAYILSA